MVSDVNLFGSTYWNDEQELPSLLESCGLTLCDVMKHCVVFCCVCFQMRPAGMRLLQTFPIGLL